MNRTIITLGLGLCLALLLARESHQDPLPKNKCIGPNEQYYKCLPDCPKNCLNKDNPPTCTQECKKSGCHCKPGYMRSNTGMCILEKNCKSPSPPGPQPQPKPEEGYGGGKPETSYENKPESKPGYGNQPESQPGYGKQPESQPGYGNQPESQPGYGKQPESQPGYGNQPESQPGYGNKPESQPDKCSGPNEQYYKCLPNCPKNCLNKDNPPTCTQECKESGCHCKPGYMRATTGMCILEKNCKSPPPPAPKPQPRPEEGYGGNQPETSYESKPDSQSGYGNQPESQPGYGNQPESQPGYGNKPESQPGYGNKPESQPGYGNKLESQPDKCIGPNEQYYECLPNCPKNCLNKNNPPMCAQDCKNSGCHCKAGYLRATTGMCILEKNCKSPPPPPAPKPKPQPRPEGGYGGNQPETSYESKPDSQSGYGNKPAPKPNSYE